MTHRPIRGLVAALLVVAGCGTAPTPKPEGGAGPAGEAASGYALQGQGNPLPGVAPPNSSPRDRTYAEWNAAWWKWAWTQPAATHPLARTGDVDLAAGQAGDVWFLGGAFGSGTITRRGEVPAGTALFFPILNRAYVEDVRVARGTLVSPFPGDTLPYPLTLATYEALTTYLDADGRSTATGLTATIDGRTIGQADVERYYSSSPIFDLPLLPGTHLAVGCAVEDPVELVPGAGRVNNCWRVDTTRIEGQGSGYYLFVQPLPVGEHVIRFAGRRGTFALDVTYHLTVVPGR